MKKKTAKKVGKPKAAAKKSTVKPKAKKATAPKAAPAERPAAASSAKGTGTYTPQAITGIGWAPFRYGA